MSEHPLDVAACRREFPALSRPVNGQTAVYFDGPAGSQVPRRVADAVADYLINANANCGGRYDTSRESDAMLARARAALADFVGTDDPETVVFGPNMTSLTFAFSRAMARTWKAGDEIIVTRLDHDGNVTPWVLAARDAGAKVLHVDLRPDDVTLDMDDLRGKLSERTRLVAVGCASNAVGTINPVAEITRLAHEAGAEVYLDAVHFAPHSLVDVAAWGCDFAVCSAYKFFGPHLGVLWGRRERLTELESYKLRVVSPKLPGKWMTGTQNHEGIAGTLAAVQYLADLGRHVAPEVTSRREALRAAYRAIGEYEMYLAKYLLEQIRPLAKVRVLGICDTQRLGERVPTFSILHERLAPADLAEHLGQRGIFAYHGNFYALALSERLGLEPGGMLRIGLLHYNTIEEIDRLTAALNELE